MAATAKPLILIADDDRTILNVLKTRLGEWGYRVGCAADKAALLQEVERARPDVLLLDLQFGDHDGVEVMRGLRDREPDLPVVFLTGNGTIDGAVHAIKHGACDFLTKPPDWDRLERIIGHLLEQQRLKGKIKRLEHLVTAPTAPTIHGTSAAIQQLHELIAAVAPTDATCLILGESGTGKELVARAIHHQSPRRDAPFVPVNTTALPRELVESTLFGHERGAFTGADRARIGCCEAADGGTLFLDEIGDVDPAIQAKLLRFLQEKTIQRVGSNETRALDVRVVAATNRDLRSAVQRGEFREDLFYRLSVIPVTVPPLRARRDDIPLLASHFLRRAARRHNRPLTGFGPRALAALCHYDWPGNVRQLENLIERLAILARTAEIDLADLPDELRGLAAEPRLAAHPATAGVLHELEKHAIIDALLGAHGDVGAAARRLGLGVATVYRKIKRYGLPRPRQRRRSN
jgi:DNA-binding NtrC family response regulator